jgi:cupin superfamily acireductone dioxygenase involved in methionine salvage
MENFNAEQAKQIVNSLHTDELHNILVDIKSKAEQGETVLHIYKSIKAKTKQVLTEKGFKVIDQPSIAIQKDGLYYSIYWA